MIVSVNGNPLALELAEGASLGEALGAADELIDKAGSVIVGIRVDGNEVDADSYPAFSPIPASKVGKVEISAEDGSAIRIRAIDTLLELVALADKAARGASDALPDAASRTAPVSEGDWAALRAGAADMRDAFAGLFAADELSIVRSFAEIMEKAGDAPSRDARAEIATHAGRIVPIFAERLAELRAPAQEMRSAAALFASRASALGELPVLLQTGKEDQAMREVLFFIEIFNKVIRVIPELRKCGVETGELRVGDIGLADFYNEFNAVLRELTEAFEHKDAVLIGDLAEYEVLPRMTSFFTAMEGALEGR